MSLHPSPDHGHAARVAAAVRLLVWCEALLCLVALGAWALGLPR